jgi:hypothetical protein
MHDHFDKKASGKDSFPKKSKLVLASSNSRMCCLNTAIDNFRKDMAMVGQELDEKCDDMKRAMEILEKQHSLSQQKMGTSTKPNEQHILELLEAKTSFDFLGKESFPLAFLSKWSCIQHHGQTIFTY